MTVTTETQSPHWLRNIKRLNCANGAHTLSKRMMHSDYYSHLPEPKSPNRQSGRDITEETESVNSHRDTKSSTFKTDEKVKKTVSFGSEIWSDGTVKSRGGWMKSSHKKVRSDKSRKTRGIPDEVMCSEESRDVEATPDFGSDDDNSSRASPTPSETVSDIDQETLREARKLILSAKLLLLSLEKKDEYFTKEILEDEDVSQSDSMHSEENNPDETRDEETTTEALNDNLEHYDQNETDSMIEVSLETQMMEQPTVDQSKQRTVVETKTLPEKDDGSTDRELCPSPPAIRRVFLKDGLKAISPSYPAMATTTVLTDETRSLAGLSVVAKDQAMQHATNLNTTKKHSSTTSDADTMSSLSADPVPKSRPLSSSVGSVSVAERVRRWSQAHASASVRGNMNDFEENQKGFFWRSHPNQHLETNIASE
ncbi:hypothetical protein FisN_40Hh026 [Fistulifera solaris]|uniref:Uncharacterized protein n=1 Tax=Fistulifera solaris TaxID=1519565 RepID=A0A1Z5K6V7_FISSO|nr:hypothetical protein FisN_40Hh026 [Fistulifera solaris]|eukprot:GAX21925.1 hypothetical protein FisN_40Hh026 [Fistulifera solaris]